MRIPSHIALAASVLLVTLSATAATSLPGGANSGARCEALIPTVSLHGTQKEGDRTLGLFEVPSPYGERPTEPVVLTGSWRNGRFFVDEPYATFEYKSLSGAWSPLPYVPGTYLGFVEHAIGLGKSETISAYMPSDDVAEQASQWRLVLRVSGGGCLNSQPFRVVQERGPVKGFVTIDGPAASSGFAPASH